MGHEPDLSGTIADFLKRKGVLRIVLELGTEDRRFTELLEEIPVSSSTLSLRLKEGLYFGLWEKKVAPENRGTGHDVYVPTENSVLLYRKLADLGAEESYTLYKRFLREFEDRCDDLYEWADQAEADGELVHRWDEEEIGSREPARIRSEDASSAEPSIPDPSMMNEDLQELFEKSAEDEGREE